MRKYSVTLNRTINGKQTTVTLGSDESPILICSHKNGSKIHEIYCLVQNERVFLVEQICADQACMIRIYSECGVTEHGEIAQ